MKVRIKSKPKLQEGGSVPQTNFLATMSQFPNLYHNYSNVGIVNSNITGTNDDDISSSLNPIDRNLANVEAEKGEVVVKPFLEGIYKINGKPHSKGGTPLSLEEGSFIFSNTPEMTFGKEQLEILGLSKMKDATPAKVIGKLVDAKEYNSLINILSDPKTDKIQKETAALMLDKLQQKIGEVAFLQEAMKGLKGELPNFAQVPANPMDRELEKIQKQYMQEGGIIAWSGDRYSGKKNASKYTTEQWRNFANELGFKGKDNKEFQQFLYNDPRFKDIIDKGHYDNRPGPTKGKFDGMLGVRWDLVYDNYYKSKPNLPAPTDPNLGIKTPESLLVPPPAEPTTSTVSTNSKSPEKKEGPQVIKDQWKGFDINPTGLETLTAVAPGLMSLASRPEYAMLAQMHTPDPYLDKINLEDAKQRVREGSNTATREAFKNMRGSQATAAALNMLGESDQRIESIDSQEENTNVGIENQRQQMIAQNRLRDNSFNIGQILDVNMKNSLTRQRRQEEIKNGFAQSLNNMGVLETSLTNLENSLNMMSMPFVTGEKNADGTDKVYMGEDGKLHQRSGVPISFDQNRKLDFNSNFGSLNTFGTLANAGQDATSEMVSIATQEVMDALKSKDPERIKAASLAYNVLLKGNQKGPSATQNASSAMSQYSQQILGLLSGLNLNK